MKGGGIVFHPTSKRRVPAVSGHRARPGVARRPLCTGPQLTDSQVAPSA